MHEMRSLKLINLGLRDERTKMPQEMMIANDGDRDDSIDIIGEATNIDAEAVVIHCKGRTHQQMELAIPENNKVEKVLRVAKFGKT
jgi:hypothetical protein